MKVIYRRLLFILTWYIIYPNLWYFLIIPEIFSDSSNFIFLLVILLSYLMGIVDVSLRPFSEDIQDDWSTNRLYSIIIVSLFLLNPLIVILAFKESIVLGLLPKNPILQMIGLLVFLIGGTITILGRYQLKQYGSGILKIKDDHELLTSGIYHYIRHPIYSGGLIGLIGYYILFGSIVVFLIIFPLYFIVFRHRIIFEENMLVNEFGEKYEQYKKESYRLVPFIY